MVKDRIRWSKMIYNDIIIKYKMVKDRIRWFKMI